MFEDREGKDEWKKLNRVITNSRWKLFSKCKVIEGMELRVLCPLADQLISNDAYLSEQSIIDSAPSSFGGELREDAFFVRNSFERQFNTLYEIIWMLVYRSISSRTFTGPYVSQIPNYEIRLVNGIRTIHRMGWCALTWNGEVTKPGAILLLWLDEIGELDDGGKRFLHHFENEHPGPYEKRWQQDLC